MEFDINNLDMYEDSEIYETDEFGFVLLPKRYSKEVKEQLEKGE